MPDNSPKHRIVFLTALPVEYRALRAHLTDLTERTLPDFVYEQGKFTSTNSNWEVFLSETGQGNNAAGLAAERAVKYLKPDYVFFVGVAGGLKEAQMGDIVVAEYVYPYTSGKAGIQFRPRPHALISTSHLIARAKSLAKKQNWLQRIQGGIPASVPQVFIASIASGDQVITSKDSEAHRVLETHFDDTKAVEMEGYGFLHTLKDYPTIGAVVIRGISDKLENKEEADRQEYQMLAARHASAFAVGLLESLDTSFTNDVPGKSSREEPETASTLQDKPHIFFEHLREQRHSIDEAFAPFIGQEDIYRDECSQAIDVLDALYTHLESRNNTFFSYPEVYFGLNNLCSSVSELKRKMQNFHSLYASPQKFLQRLGYKSAREKIRQECIKLLQQLNILQSQWARRERA